MDFAMMRIYDMCNLRLQSCYKQSKHHKSFNKHFNGLIKTNTSPALLASHFEHAAAVTAALCLSCRKKGNARLRS